MADRPSGDFADRDSIRNKRLKLSDPRSAGLASDSEASSSAMSPTSKQQELEDEKYARQLQLEIGFEERYGKKDVDIGTRSSSAPPKSFISSHFDPDLAAALGVPEPQTACTLHQQAQKQLDALKAVQSGYGVQPAPASPHHSLMNLFADRRKKQREVDVSVTEIQAHELDQSVEGVAVRTYAKRMLGTSCSNCGFARPFDQEALVAHFRSSMNEMDTANRFNFMLTCPNPNCKHKTCPGCFITLDNPSLEFGASALDDTHITWHCDEGRLALIWYLLCGYDNEARHNKCGTTTVSKPAPTKKPRRSFLSRNRQGSASMPKGVGYAPDYDEHMDEEYFYNPVPTSLPSSSAFYGYGASTGPAYTSPFSGPGVALGGNTASPPPPPSINLDGAIAPPTYPPTAPKSGPVSSLLPGPGVHIGGQTAPKKYTSFGSMFSRMASSPSSGTGMNLNGNTPASKFPQIAPKPSNSGASLVTLPGVDLSGKVTPPATRRASAHDINVDDKPTTNVMSTLAAILPSKANMIPTAFDIDPPPILSSMLLRSSILDKTAELLRNDSLEDASARCQLYSTLTHFLQAMAGGNRVTAAVLHAERPVNKAGHSLLKVSYGVPTRMKDESENSATPIAMCMVNLTQQSNMMLKNAQSHGEIFDSEEGQALLLLCNQLIECSQVLQDATPRRTGKGKMQEPEEDRDAWQKEFAVMDVPDEELLAVHYSAQDARNCTGTAPGRMRHLVKEITNLQTSLPPGIFLRYGESRLDVMKVLIVGPKGTPYEYGLFEFDLFCPERYPNEPPKMQLKTTGGGRCRFNPNLYANGKVCLSLLNTWQGQKWTPGQSTILQVLVSIQAMIFCDEPHCNEPGFEMDVGSETSKQYNRSLYPNTIRFAMLEWLEGKRNVTPLRRRREEILQQHQEYLTPDQMKEKLKSLKPEQTEEQLMAQVNEQLKQQYKKQFIRPNGVVDKGNLWAEVVKRHFESNGAQILDTVCMWLEDKGKEEKHHKRGRGRTLAEADAAAEKSKKVEEGKKKDGGKRSPADFEGRTLAEKLRSMVGEFQKVTPYGVHPLPEEFDDEL